MDVTKRLGAEVLGTFWLVLGGCGSAVLAAKVLNTDGAESNLGIGFVGVSLAFGLTVLTGAYAFGHVSGGHFNPAVTLGLVASKRFDAKDAAPYIGAQLVGAIIAAAVLWAIALGQDGMTGDALAAGGFAANGYGDHSPGGYTLLAGLLTEVVLTAVFLFVILGATDKRSTAPVAGVAIGLCLTLIHLVSIPVTNTSVNPARSTGPALMLLIGGEGWAMGQLWLFWVAPIIGAAIAGIAYTAILGDQDAALAEGADTA
jgi:aquaporin Z